MNFSSKRRSKIIIIPSNAENNDERECDAFKLVLRRRQNVRKFLVLRNERKALEVRNKLKTESGTTNISKNDLISSNKVLDEQPEKLKEKVNSLSHMSKDAKNILPTNLNHLISDRCKEAHDGETSKCSQDKAIGNSSPIFYTKRKPWPKFNNEECQIISLPKNKSYCSVENLLWTPSLAQQKVESSNGRRDVIELRRNFLTLAKQLKLCETDEDKCFIIIKIVHCCLKGPFNHLCNRIVPKLILMMEEMCRKEESKMCCSVALFALIKTELISSYSDISALVISLMETNISPSHEMHQENRSILKIQKHLHVLNFLEENEKFEILQQYTACDFAIDCILKFSSYAETDTFKIEFQCMGGLDIILDIVNSQTIIIWNEQLPSKVQLYNIVKLEHCLNILQNVVFRTPENQNYVLHYRNFQILQNLSSVLQFIQHKYTSEFDKTSTVEYTKCLSSALKLLINITHKNVEGSIHIEKQSEILVVVLFFLTSLPHSNQEADIALLLLGLTANLIMTSKETLHRFTTLKVNCWGLKHEVNSIVALSKMFHKMYLEAKKLENSTEKLLTINTFQKCDNVDEFEMNMNTVFHSAGHHMEHSMMCSFLALIVGYVIEDNKEHVYLIRNALPDIQFESMATVLKEFHDVVSVTDLLENVDVEEIQRIVNVLLTL